MNNNDLSMLSALKEAWQLIYGIKWLVIKRSLLAIFFFFVTAFPLAVIVGFCASMFGFGFVTIVISALCLVLLIYIVYMSFMITVPIYAICFMRALQAQINMDEILANRDKNSKKLMIVISWIILANIIIAPLYNFPIVTFWAPMVITLVLLLPLLNLCVPLIVMRSLNFMDALNLSYKIYIRYAQVIIPWSLLFIVTPSYIIGASNDPLTISVLALVHLIVSIWTIPLMGVIYGLAYRNYSKG